MTRLLLILLAAVVIAGGELLTRPSDRYIVKPGGSYQVAERLTMPDEYRRDMGRIAFTAVLTGPATWGDVISARITRGSETVPREEIIPPGSSQRQVNEVNGRLMDESKPIAALVGLRAAGFEAHVTGSGVDVVGVIEGTPAHGTLRQGDVIVQIDGQAVQTTADLTAAIRQRQVGDQLALLVERDGTRQPVAVGTRNSPTETGVPQVGVTISTRDFRVELPFQVDVETGSVGGPSAGFIIALGILDGVTEGDLMRGYSIAGTGTVDANGNVGGVGGIGEKVLAAEHDGADIFLAPRRNGDEARSRARRTRVVPVATLDDAVRYLCSLPPKPGTPASGVTPEPCR